MRRLALLPPGGADDPGPAEAPPPAAAGEGGTAGAGGPEAAGAPPPAPEPLPPGALADLRAWLRRELAAELAASRVVQPLLLELDRADAGLEAEALELPEPAELGDMAGAAGAELAFAAAIDAGHGAQRLRVRLAGADGEERLQLDRLVDDQELSALPRQLARELLLAVGEDAAAPPPSEPEPVPPAALLALCRAARQLEEARREPEVLAPPEALPAPPPPASEAAQASQEASAPAAGAGPAPEDAAAPPIAAAAAPPPPGPAPEPPRLRAADPGDPAEALAGLLDALALAPQLTAARRLLLEEAEAAAGGPWMPAFLAALEKLVERLPGDSEAMLALAAFRRLHLDADGARELALAVRDLSEEREDTQSQLRALELLAGLAEEAGRFDEAALHLRAAVRLADDPALYLRLGLALRRSSPVESLRALQRAVALAPDDGAPRLELARALLLAGDPERCAAEAARVAQQFHRHPEPAREAAALLRELMGADT